MASLRVDGPTQRILSAINLSVSRERTSSLTRPKDRSTNIYPPGRLGLTTQLFAGDGAVRGYLIGCVTYHDDLIERPLHTTFVFDVTFAPITPRTRQFVKDFRERKGLMGITDYLPVDDIHFAPNEDASSYYY